MTSRPTRARRAVAMIGAAAGVALLAALGPGSGSAVVAGATRKAGINGLVPAGTRIGGMENEFKAVPPDTVADRDTVSDQLKYARQAKSLPIAERGRRWVNVGPLGQDDPADYPTGPIRFSRAAGMGVAIMVDPRDASGNSLYAGTMGGLWYSKDAGAHWKALGDGTFARSAVGAVAVDPRRPTDVYVGTGVSFLTISGDSQGSGVYVSHDGGRTFRRPAANIKGYGVNDIKVTPTGVLVGSTNGLYLSTDRGGSFRRVALPNNAAHNAPAKGAYANWISAIAVNPVSPRTVTVAVGMAYGKRKDPDGRPLSPGNGLYRSTAGAAGRFSWFAGTAGLTHPAASADPIGRVMLSYATDSTGDNAVLWALVSDAGLVNKQQPGGLDVVGSTTGRSLNATNTLLNGLYRSDDDGATWTVKATPQSLAASVNEGLGIYPALGYGVGVQAYYNLWVVAEPGNPDNVYFGLEEVFQSVANTGDTPGVGNFEIIQRYWDVCGSTTYLENVFTGVSCPDQTPYYGGVSTHPDQHVGVLAKTSNGGLRLYTGNDGGFFREDKHALPDGRNGFDNKGWAAMNSLASVEAWKVARKPDGEYLTGLQDNGGGFFRPGQTAKLVTSGDGTNALATSDPDTFYFSAQGAILWVTTDHGKHIRNMQPDMLGAGFLSPVEIDPTDENHLVAAGQSIEETTKGPDTQTVLDPVLYTVVKTDWTRSFDAGTSPGKSNTGVAAPWTTQAIGVRGAAVYAAICGLCRNSLHDPTEIHTTVATNMGKAGCTPKKASTDCWHKAAGRGLPHVAINGIAVDPQDPKTIYVALNENSLIGLDPKQVGAARVMVSHNAGASFTDITGNLPRSNARDVVVRDGKLIVGTDHGVFVGSTKGGRWSRLGTGLPAVRVFDLSLDRTGRHLTISAYGRGVWDLDFGKAARSHSAGPGPNGEPTRPSPRSVPSPRRLPVPALPGPVGVLATVLGGALAVSWRRRRRTGLALAGLPNTAGDERSAPPVLRRGASSCAGVTGARSGRSTMRR